MFIGLAVAALMIFGRRKIKDFSNEMDPLLMTAGSSDMVPMEDPSETGHGQEEGDKLEELNPKPSYQSTDEEPARPSSSGPAFGRQTTNPAGLVARPQYNPTGIYNGLFGKKDGRKGRRES